MVGSALCPSRASTRITVYFDQNLGSWLNQDRFDPRSGVANATVHIRVVELSRGANCE
jgi:hypothetical protein